MEINGNNVRGIFLFSENLKLKLGDFVIFEDGLFICNNDVTTSLNNTPDKDLKNYRPYLFSKEATWEDFNELHDTGTVSKDGIITSRVLSKILKKLHFGINSEGLITEEVMKEYISPGLGEFTKGNINTLDQLILDSKNTEMNNLTIKIDRVLPGCLITTKPNELLADEDFKSVILKQYTYKEASNDEFGGKITIRVQEIIDHVFGVCFYRYAKIEEYSSEGDISSWKQSNVTTDYINKLAVFNSYLQEKSSSVGFNFRKINLSEPYINGQNKQYSVNLNEASLITVTISGKLNTSNIAENYSMTVKVDGNTYRFPNGLTICCNNNSISLDTMGNIDFVIIDVYARTT